MFKEWNMLENNFPSFTDGVIKWKKCVYKNTAPLQLKIMYLNTKRSGIFKPNFPNGPPFLATNTTVVSYGAPTVHPIAKQRCEVTGEF